jgi:NADPH:quinone reductase-like Zn-dependent oxidoreductase
MTGTPYAMRLSGFGLRAPKNPVLGYDVAGRVEAVGAQLTAFRPEDEVFGTCRGSFAEYAVARADRLASKPDKISLVQAAAVPISDYAALQAVRDHGSVRAGQRVLIIGAGGASAHSPYRSRRRTERRSRASAAPPRPSWCARSVPTT